MIAIITFLSFGATSAYFGFQGVASCGCLGMIKASPWLTFVVDVIIILSLLLARPRLDSLVDHFQKKDNFLSFARTTLAGFIVLGLILFFLRSETVQNFLSEINHKQLILQSDYVSMEELKTGEVSRKSIKITNRSNKSVTLLGGSSDCSCVVTYDLPIVIEPKSRKEIQISLKPPQGVSGNFSRLVVLWTDLENESQLQFVVSCTVVY